LAAGLLPDPLRELKRSTDPLAAIRVGGTSKGGASEGRGRTDEDRKGEGMGEKKAGAPHPI